MHGRDACACRPPARPPAAHHVAIPSADRALIRITMTIDEAEFLTKRWSRADRMTNGARFEHHLILGRGAFRPRYSAARPSRTSIDSNAGCRSPHITPGPNTHPRIVSRPHNSSLVAHQGGMYELAYVQSDSRFRSTRTCTAQHSFRPVSPSTGYVVAIEPGYT